MRKYYSLIKACMTEDMNLFKISTKKKNTFTKIGVPILLSVLVMSVIFGYAGSMMELLEHISMESFLLIFFILVTSIMTLVEGIYKSSNLLFNCKDDNFLLSLPIKKSLVLFIRIFKFYIFELLYNSLFLIPAIIVYALHIHPGFTYYIISFIGLIVFPIIPIVLSCLIGMITTLISSKFKGRNYVQTILTVTFLVGVLYFSYNLNSLLNSIVNNASSINDMIVKFYYPAGAFLELVTDFSIIKLFEFIIINIGVFFLTVILLGNIYFKINSKTKSIKVKESNKKYTIKTNRPISALVKKEFTRFINSTVFVANAGFGLVLFIIICVFLTIKFDSATVMIASMLPDMSLEYVNSSMPAIVFGLVCLTSFMTSITSSMISLEGKSFNILKSLPIKPYTIIQSKVLAAILLMIPCILVGDIILFIRFKFDFISIFYVLIASILLPLISETIGILINLKYPRMDAKNDTEVVKQSMSSSISVFIGMGLAGISLFLLVTALQNRIPINTIMILFTSVYLVIYIGLTIILHKISDKSFRNIVV